MGIPSYNQKIYLQILKLVSLLTHWRRYHLLPHQKSLSIFTLKLIKNKIILHIFVIVLVVELYQKPISFPLYSLLFYVLLIILKISLLSITLPTSSPFLSPLFIHSLTLCLSDHHTFLFSSFLLPLPCLFYLQTPIIIGLQIILLLLMMISDLFPLSLAVSCSFSFFFSSILLTLIAPVALIIHSSMFYSSLIDWSINSFIFLLILILILLIW